MTDTIARTETPFRPIVTRRDRMHVIIAEVAEAHGIRVRDVQGRDRAYRYVRARQHAMFRLRTELGLSMPRIARIWGMDASTVRSGLIFYRKRMGLV